MTTRAGRLAALALAAWLAAGLGAGAPLSAQAAGPGDGAAAQPGDPYAVLSAYDVELYREIFEVQERGAWDAADRAIAKLNDRVLMGHVLYQRYMHPTAYRSKYTELRDWLDQYADHPGAYKIYKLAQRRKPGGVRSPERPLPRRYRLKPADPNEPTPPPSISSRRHVSSVQRKVRSLVYRERPTQALGYIDSPNIKRTLTPVEYDEARGLIAQSYFIEQVDEKAYRVATSVAQSNRTFVPLADWYAGLSAWRLGYLEEAAQHFEALSAAPGISDDMRSAGAYWAARAYLLGGEPAKVTPLLETAAAHELSFYGQLAVQQLGDRGTLNWSLPQLTPARFQALLKHPVVARAVALGQVGRLELAEEELLRAHGYLPADEDEALVALAARMGYAATQLQVSDAASRPVPAALYPIPEWQPQSGFTLDRALVYAFMRQESKFKPTAKSPAGARGLMQLMPRTASYVAKDRSLRSSNRDKLFDPAFNLDLGQSYLSELMEWGDPHGNLFMVAVGYNAGPGNLRKWLRETDFRGDPLLFIESMPSRETRSYVERVIANLWLYRQRLGQAAPSLEALAGGEWPVYVPLDRPGGPFAARGVQN